MFINQKSTIMSGGGHMSQMQTMLKNNLRKKRRLFNTLQGYIKNSNKTFVHEKKATQEQLNLIKEKIKNEQKKEFKKSIIILFCLTIVLFFIFKGLFF